MSGADAVTLLVPGVLDEFVNVVTVFRHKTRFPLLPVALNCRKFKKVHQDTHPRDQSIFLDHPIAVLHVGHVTVPVGQLGSEAPMLIWALMTGNAETLQLLVDAGADVNAYSDEDGITALMLACTEENSVAEVSVLLDAGAEINRRDNDGRTALIWASEAGRADVVRLLLDAGADVNIRDDEGQTALDVAVENGDTVTAQLLSTRGAAR